MSDSDVSEIQIYVDADACPVKGEIVRVAERHGLTVHMVSNGGLRPNPNPRIRSVMVPEGPDVADDWIAERAGPRDVAITGDIPLAARCLQNGARVLGHNGRPFTEDGIGMALAARDLNAHLRDTGEIRGGGPSFGKQDRSRFLDVLETTIQALKRAG
ncbi:MAG: YaiI/YqxD family protein [Bauldia litoralis]